MAIKFYKKLTPQTKVVLPDNTGLQFTSLDGLTGYFATDQEALQQFFARCMAEQRYCISEIPEQEFKAEYLEKKNLPQLKPVWREEYGKGQTRGQPLITQLPPAVVADAVGVKARTDARCSGTAIETVPPAAATPAPTLNKPPEHTPPVGKRKRTTAPTT